MKWTARIMLAAVLTLHIGPGWTQDRRPDARLRFSSFAIGLLFGFNQGEGSLEFAERQYPFKISGITLATVGISQVNAIGQVYRLRQPADLAGRYFAVAGGLTVIQGGGNTVLRNEKGVTLYLQNVQQGLDLTLGGGGFSIEMTADTATPASMDSAPAR
jgi:hypothetical protein